MSRITKRWLSPELQNEVTGMQGDISTLEIGLTGTYQDIAGLTGAVAAIETDIAGLTGAVAAVETDIAGLTGAVSNIETNIAGMTAAINNLELCCTGVNDYLSGLTGAVNSLATYMYNIQAIQVGFSPITGAGSTNVQGAIEALVDYVNAGLTGVNYGVGLTGAQGFTGIDGIQGATGVGAGSGVLSHSMLTGMPDNIGVVEDHDVRLVAKVQSNTPSIPTPFTGMFWFDLDAAESMGVTGTIGATGAQGLTGVFGSFLTNVKLGSTQIAAGAVADEIWKTSGHSTLPDNVLMIGV